MPGSNEQVVAVIRRAILPLWPVALSSLVTVSCQDAVALPAVDTCPHVSVPLCTDGQVTALVTADIDDALSRSVPALEDAAVRDALTASLGQLDSALAGGNLSRSRDALNRSRELLGPTGAGSASTTSSQTSLAGDQPDLTAVDLLLNQVAIVL